MEALAAPPHLVALPPARIAALARAARFAITGIVLTIPLDVHADRQAALAAA